MIRAIPLLSGLALFSLPAAAAEPAVVLVSAPSEPFQEAAAELKGALGVEVVDFIQEPDALYQLSEAPPELVVALGSLASQTTAALLPGRPLLSCLVQSVEPPSGHPEAAALTLEHGLEIQLDYLQRILPDARTLGVLYNPNENASYVEELSAYASQRGLSVEPRPVSSPTELPGALSSLNNLADVLWGMPDTIVYTPQTAKAILLFSFRNRIPLAGVSDAWVQAGALYALERDYADLGSQCAEMAKQIQAGASPSGLPPEMPREVRLLLNQRTASEMRLEFSPGIAAEASHVY